MELPALKKYVFPSGAGSHLFTTSMKHLDSNMTLNH
jgi:hypothetical protein